MEAVAHLFGHVLFQYTFLVLLLFVRQVPASENPKRSKRVVSVLCPPKHTRSSAIGGEAGGQTCDISREPGESHSFWGAGLGEGIHAFCLTGSLVHS